MVPPAIIAKQKGITESKSSPKTGIYHAIRWSYRHTKTMLFEKRNFGN
jgi:hypothetical protein